MKDYQLALRMAHWLFEMGCAAITIVVKPDQVEINYTLKLDMKPQPAIIVRDGKLTFPAGSQEDVVLTFLLSGGQ